MNLTVMKPVEIVAKSIRVNVPIRYGDEDVPHDLPFRRKWQKGDTGDDAPRRRYDRWDVVVGLDTGMIEGWPEGRAASVHLKVCDEGVYTLLSESGNQIARVFEDYVPCCIPEGGDYIAFDVDESGHVKGWESDCDPTSVREAFFPPRPE